jgi:DNA-binding protein Fis
VITADDIVLGRPDTGRDGKDVGGITLPPDGVDLYQLEQELLKQAMLRASGNQTRAAALLHLSRDTFRYRLSKHGLL